jgi:hypothetical protein
VAFSFTSAQSHYVQRRITKGKCKAIPLQACTDPEGFQEFETPRSQGNQHMNVGSFQAYTEAAFTHNQYSWYSFLLEAEYSPGPKRGRKDYFKKKIPVAPSRIEPALFRLVAH